MVDENSNQEAGGSVRPGGSGEAPGLARAAADLITTFALLIKMAVVHDRANEALVKPVEHFVAALAGIYALSSGWQLRLMNESLFINDSHLKMGRDIHAQYLTVVEEMRRRGVGLLSFERVPNPQQALAFIYRFMGHEAAQGIGSLREALQGAELDFIQVEAIQEQLYYAPGADAQFRQKARDTFLRSIFVTGGLLQAVDQQKVLNLRRARRTVQSFIDLIDLDESYLLGLSSIKNYDEYTFNHSVNVAILGLGIGRRIGLSRAQLTDLGLSALFHDLGKTTLPRELVNKCENLNENDWHRIQTHPVEGLKKLFRIKGVTELTVKLLISVYEHHINFDFSGYPDLKSVFKEQTLFSRILRIVDSYDAMTTKRPYCARPKHPVEAIEEIFSLSGKNFDPDLVKIFIGMMGFYPVGTIVQLDSGEIGMVVRNPSEMANLGKPTVEVVGDWEGKGPTGHHINLLEDKRTIVGYYDFGELDIHPAWYLLLHA